MAKKKEEPIKRASRSRTGKDVASNLPPSKDVTFRIVGIGASAGGLEAFEQFFSNMPADTGMGFVIVQHLDPTGHSSMPQILSRFTKMPINVATDGIRVEPNSVYLLPPNKSMGIQNGSLYLEEPARPPGLRLPIDFFFRSLAKEMGADAICIVLSGTGTDGTLGIRAIKAELGTVFVQDPESARYDGMPRSAVDTGLADFVLKPAEMPKKLVQFVEHSVVNGAKFGVTEEEAVEPLKQIFAILRTRTGHDFARYKQTTIRRRLQRRMSVNQINDIAQYAKFLKENEDEVKALLKDLLISVTNFFRDAEAFEALKKQMKELIKSKAQGSDIRVWVAGCATGEEAYSVAIIIQECLEELEKHLQVQMYGTDIDVDALHQARLGKYPANIAADVTPDRLKRFFIKENDAYRVKKEIREEIVFAPHNFIKDPPFSKMDLICCRNLLIYLEGDVQKRLLPLLHYALKPGGILFLGPSETAGEATDLFTLLDRKWKLYERREAVVSAERLKFPAAFAPRGRESIAELAADAEEAKIPQLTEKIFLDSYAPTFAVIDEKYRLVYVRGRTGKYLEIASGQPTLSVLEMAREGLRTELTSAVYRAISEKKKITHEGIKVKYNGGFQTVNLTVAPLTEPGIPHGLLMVVFQEAGLTTLGAEIKPSVKSRKHVIDMEDELRLTKENLQTTIEELEATNEELKSANEELQSNNEELQSTNEELDTSREELQSLNEELTTLNAEIQDKNDLLTRANDDLKNFLNRTDIALIFLDEELKIRSYTPATSDVFNIREIDISRPLGDITSKLAYDGVVSDAQDVLRTLRPKEIEVQRKDGAWYKMRILPYLTAQNVVSGLVMSFLDIDVLKKSADELIRVNQQLDDMARFPQENPNPILRVGKDGTILIANPACSLIEAFKCNKGEMLPKKYKKTVTDVLNNGSPQAIDIEGKTHAFTLNFVPILKSGYVNIYSDDITERKKAEKALKESEERFRALNETSPVGVGVSSADGVILYTNPSYERILGYSTGELKGKKASDLYCDPKDRQSWSDALKLEGVLRYFEVTLKRKDGTPAWVSISASPVIYSGQPATMGTIQDITERKKAEEELTESEEKFKKVFYDSPIAQTLAILPEGKWTEVNNSFLELTGYTHEEVIGHTSLELNLIDTEERNRILADVIKQGSSYRQEIKIRDKNGNIKFIQQTNGVVKINNQPHILAIMIDISKLKKAQEELKIKDYAISSSLTGIGITDMNGDLTYVNRALVEMGGYKEKEIIGKSAYLFFKDQGEVSAAFKTVKEKGFWQGELTARKKNGATFIVQALANRVTDEKGIPIYLMASLVDITERKQIEENLRETSDYLNNLIDYANAPIAVWNSKFEITRFNHAFEELTGRNSSEVVGQRVDILIPAAQRENAMAKIKRATIVGEKWEVVEIPILHASGEVRTVLWNSATIFSPDGKTPFATIAQGQDITELKKADLLKDEFIGMVSHELKTPITVVMGDIYTALSEKVSQDDARELLKDAANSSESLASIVDNLLELSRAQANRLEMKKERLNIAQFIQRVTKKLEGKSTLHRMVLDIPTELPEVSADHVRLERILTNLLDNAIKYSPQGGDINVSVQQKDGYLKIGVKDSGIGISKEDQEKIFKPFGRVEATKIGGVGLGLNVCQRLVAAHGGQIWLESEPGKGSTFFFTIPLQDEQKRN